LKNNYRSRMLPMLLYIGIFALLLTLFSRYGTTQNPVEISYSEALTLFEEEKVSSFSTQNNVLTLNLRESYKDSTVVSCQITSVEFFRDDAGELIKNQTQAGILEEYDYLPNTQKSTFAVILPWAIMGVVLVFLLVFLLNRGNANSPMNNFGKANVRFGTGKGKKVTFADVAGADEEKEELQEVVDYLKHPAKYTAIGAKIPKGILLVGPPGTGKTLIAKAVAGEADVQFLSISGSDFVEMFVGVGASRVRDLFETAKKLSPAIIFIDEIDAVGRKRGAGLGGGHDEKEQTLNQLLVEMDGFSENEGVIVLAATNRKDILDPALLRPGRFDRQIYIGYPTAQGREEILKVHAKEIPLSDDVSLHTIAMATSGFTGASLANLLNEAALLAARDDRPVVCMKDLEEAMMKVLYGPKKHSKKVTEHEQKLTAFHEAGHAVAMYYLPTHEPVHQITIIPRGPTGGMTISLPEHDSLTASRNEMYEDIVSFLGGQIAEALEFGDITTGASNDLERATGLARDMITRYGMSEAIGPVSYADGSEIFVGRDYERTKSYSERTAGNIDDEVKRMMEQAYAQCRSILTEHRDQLTQVADYLLAHDTMNREQFEACMEGREIPEADNQTTLFDRVLGKEPEQEPAEEASEPSEPCDCTDE